MKIANIEMENTLKLDKHITTFVIENKKYFFKYVEMFLSQNKGGEGDFVFSQNNKILSISKNILIINDLFSISLNERKILNALFQEINLILNDQFLESYYSLNSSLINLMNSVILETVIPTEFDDDYDVTNLLKLLNFKFSDNNSGLVDRLIDYLLVTNQFLKPKLYILINSKNLFSENDFINLNKFLEYNKIKILFIETSYVKKHHFENIFLIDNDLCELIL